MLLLLFLLPAAQSLSCFHPFKEQMLLTSEISKEIKEELSCNACEYLLFNGGFVAGSQRCNQLRCLGEVLGKDNWTDVVVERRCCYKDACNSPELVLQDGLRCRSDMGTKRTIKGMRKATIDPTYVTSITYGLLPPIMVVYPCSKCVFGRKKGKLAPGTRTCWSAELAGGDECNKVPVDSGGQAAEAFLNVQLDEAVCCDGPECNAPAPALTPFLASFLLSFLLRIAL